MSALAVTHVVMLGLLLALAVQAVLNHRAWPRLGRCHGPSATPSIAVLIPARNEAGRIAVCLEKWATQRYPHHEVIVLDDASTDATRTEALRAGRRYGHVRVIAGDPLPGAGWRGKTWACHGLRRATTAEILVFADADVEPGPDTLTHTAAAFGALGADLVSAVPAHRSPSSAVRAVVALQNWAPLVFIPFWARPWRRRPLLAAANGQFLAVRAAVYDASGGFGAVGTFLHEDVALARHLAGHGYEVRLLDGAEVLRCHPYRRFGELWRANVRNLYPVLFSRLLVVALAVAGLAGLYLAPLGLLVVGFAGGARASWIWTLLPMAELALGLLPRVLSDRRAGYAPWLASTHPLAVAALLAMSLESARLFCTGRDLEWRGRRYSVTDRAA
jgi:cellulose synthase/poly-beta-1,6-N-acetylglucosamine synthase-like glycosyltransferase